MIRENEENKPRRVAEEDIKPGLLDDINRTGAEKEGEALRDRRASFRRLLADDER